MPWTMPEPGPDARIPCAAVLEEGWLVGLMGHRDAAEVTDVKWLCQSKHQTQSSATVQVPGTIYL